jgi:hypothetical protein
MMRLGALGGWSDPKSHRLGALSLICRPVARGHPGTHQLGDVTKMEPGLEAIAVLSTVLTGRPRPPCWPCPGRSRHRRTAPGHRQRQPQRLRSAAAFAHLCGVARSPASSGRTHRHRPNGPATAGPTTPCGASPWSGCAATRRPGPRSSGGPTKACPSSTSCAASSAPPPPRSTPPHRPTSHHADHLPEIGGIKLLTSTDTTQRDAGILLPTRVPAPSPR